jgi:superfamily II DNA/RNA helicase
MEVINYVRTALQPNNITEALIPMLKEEEEKYEKNIHHQVIVFCNTVQSCRAVHHAVVESGLRACCYHSDIPQHMQAEEFNLFQSGQVRFMVATDLIARGIDLKDVKHVIMFDFPLNIVDYLHRAGRTGRLDPNSGVLLHGKVTCLLNRKREMDLANQIQKHTKAKKPLDTVLTNPPSRKMGKQVIPRKIGGKRNQYWMEHKDRLRATRRIRGEKVPQVRRGELKSKVASGMSWKRRVHSGLDPSFNLKDTISIRNPASKVVKERRKEKTSRKEQF